MSSKTGIKWLDDVENRVKTADPAELAEKIVKAVAEAGYEPERGGSLYLVRDEADGSYGVYVDPLGAWNYGADRNRVYVDHSVHVPDPGAAMGVEAFHKMYLADNSLRDLFADTAKLLSKSYRGHGIPVIWNPAYNSRYDVTPYIPYIIPYWGNDRLWEELDMSSKEEAAMAKVAKRDYKYFCNKYGNYLAIYKGSEQLSPDTCRSDFYKNYLSAESVDKQWDSLIQRHTSTEEAENPDSSCHT